MSGKVVGWAMEQITGSPASKLVLVKLADNSNEKGYCFPSISLLVRHTELCERAVREHLSRLEALGLLTVIRRKAEGVKLPSHFQLNVEVSIGDRALNAGVMQQVHDPHAQGAGGDMQVVHIEPSIDNRKENQEIVGAGAPSTQRNGVSLNGKKASRWPADGIVPKEWIEAATWARAQAKLSEIDYQLEVEKFGNYWAAKSGTGATKHDWKRTFVNWCLNAKVASGFQRGTGLVDLSKL